MTPSDSPELEWVGRPFDDALFESMLDPMVRQILEKIFFSGPGRFGREDLLSGLCIIHREVGLTLLTAGSRRAIPRAALGVGWKTLEESFIGAVALSEKKSMATLFAHAGGPVQGIFPLLPNRIGDAGLLFLWTASQDWGRIVYFLAGPDRASVEPRIARLTENGPALARLLLPVLSAWMQDATLEVFWARILQNMPAQFRPIPGVLAPDWIRSVPVPKMEGAGAVPEECFCASDFQTPGRGWGRTVTRELRRSGDSGVRGPAAGEQDALVVPLTLWGVLPLGTIRVPPGLSRHAERPSFFHAIKRARVLAMRSLTRHLLFSGPLEFLEYWRPESECFDLAALKKLPDWVGEKVLDDPVLEIRLEDLSGLEKMWSRLRSADMILADPRTPGRIALLLRNCTSGGAEGRVLPRLRESCDLSGGTASPTLSLGRFLEGERG